MDFQRQNPAPRPLITAAVVVLGGILVFGCERDDIASVDRNLPPETFITDGPEISPDPANPTDLFYKAHLFWRGEDRDGTIAGFRYAIDDTLSANAWKFTTKTDSVFRFQAGEVGSRPHLFLLRAVDNLGKEDPSPDSLRFEAFTRAAPVVIYDTANIQVTNSAGTTLGLDFGDTTLVNSTITFRWGGSDADGEIVRWETILDAEAPREHALDDTVRTVGPLSSGRHDFLVRAFDDAGAVSRSGGLFPVVSNFDARCVIDSTAIVSRLNITWLDSDPDVDSVLVTLHDLSQPDVQDTIPFGATVSFCWECEDVDGPVVSYNWDVGGFIQGITTELCANTDSICTFNPDSGFVVCRSDPYDFPGTFVTLGVKGRDVYGRVPAKAPTVTLQLNYAPSVTIDPPTAPIPANTPVRFTFQGTDRDSDPADLAYRWWFDGQIPPGTFLPFLGQPQTDFELFAQGAHILRVQAVDQSNLDRPSAVAQLLFDVTP